jgi:hypothetical protein
VSIKSHVITGAVCLVVGAALCGGIVYTAASRVNAELSGVIRDLKQNRAAVDRELRAVGAGIAIAVRELDSSTVELTSSIDSIGRLRTLAERNRALAGEILGVAEILGKANQSLRDAKGALDALVGSADSHGDLGLDRRQDIPIK